MVWVRAVPSPRKEVRRVSSGFPIPCRWRETPCQSSVPIPLFAPNGRLSLAVGGREISPAGWGRCRMLSQFCDILLGSILWELSMSSLASKPAQGRWVSGLMGGSCLHLPAVQHGTPHAVPFGLPMEYFMQSPL